MGDELLSSGGDDARPVPRWLLALGLVAAVLAGGQGARQLAADVAPAPPPAPREQWRVVPGGELPTNGPRRLTTPTGLSALAAGDHLAQVEVDSGQVVLDDATPRPPGRRVRTLLARPAGVVVLDATPGGQAWLVRRQRDSVSLGPAGAVVPVGAAGVGLVRTSPTGVVVRPYPSCPGCAPGPDLWLAPGTTVVAGTGSTYLVADGSGEARRLRLVDAATGATRRTLATAARVVAVEHRRVAWLPPRCVRRCVVTVTDLRTGAARTAAVFSDDQVSAAFAPDGRLAVAGQRRPERWARAAPVLFVVGGPGRHHNLLPGLTSFSGRTRALAWSPDGRWLLLLRAGEDRLLAWERPTGTLGRVRVPVGLLDDAALLAVLAQRPVGAR